ncbi:hypothetical protein [Nonomuraea basaltis]|uniref:aromatic-ring hydroxylase C-terminal domain-containing protein n=1 Tax=Nonomuraea basaltis TaxID=2495887 RepID=UPI003B849899
MTDPCGSRSCCAPPAPAAALLIRPDGYVAWAEPLHRSEQPVHHGLHKALTTWFGAANQGT